MTTPQDALMPEPFGYFRAEPFGWTDCAPDDDGAIPLYERTQSARIAELEAEVERFRVNAGRWMLARNLIHFSDIEQAYSHYEQFGRLVDEQQSKLTDAAIDAARAKQAGGGVGG